MAWLPTRSNPAGSATDAGYATAGAIAVSMALALTASALGAYATAQLADARSGLKRLQAEYALDGAQQLAAVTLMKTSKLVRFRWSFSTDDGRRVEVLAEPEAAKLGWDMAIKLDEAVLTRTFALTDTPALKNRLKAALAEPAKRTPTQSLDEAPLWQACAPAVFSRYGMGKALVLPKPQAPDQQQLSWRMGEVWRVRVASEAGWTDDRVVRLTGNPVHPVAVIESRFFRSGGGEGSCERAIKSV